MYLKQSGNQATFNEYQLFIKNNSNYPFLFAPSQANKVMLDEPNYAICTIERPLLEVNEISVEYVKNNLLFAKELSSQFNKGVEDYSKFKEIRNNVSVSKLKIDILGEVRVEVNKNAIINKSHNFNSLIIDIRKELT